MGDNPLGNPNRMYFKKVGDTIWQEVPVKIIDVNCTTPEEPHTVWTNEPATATLSFTVETPTSKKAKSKHNRMMQQLFKKPFRLPRKKKKALKKRLGKQGQKMSYIISDKPLL